MWSSPSKRFKKYIYGYNIYKSHEDSISPTHFIFSRFYFEFPKTANPISFSGRRGIKHKLQGLGFFREADVSSHSRGEAGPQNIVGEQ